MGKLMDSLQKQLSTEYKKEAEDCILLYNHLKETNNGHVWSTQWYSLTTVTFKKYPSSERRHVPNNIGCLVIAGLKSKL